MRNIQPAPPQAGLQAAPHLQQGGHKGPVANGGLAVAPPYSGRPSSYGHSGAGGNPHGPNAYGVRPSNSQVPAGVRPPNAVPAPPAPPRNYGPGPNTGVRPNGPGTMNRPVPSAARGSQSGPGGVRPPMSTLAGSSGPMMNASTPPSNVPTGPSARYGGSGPGPRPLQNGPVQARHVAGAAGTAQRMNQSVRNDMEAGRRSSSGVEHVTSGLAQKLVVGGDDHDDDDDDDDGAPGHGDKSGLSKAQRKRLRKKLRDKGATA